MNNHSTICGWLEDIGVVSNGCFVSGNGFRLHPRKTERLCGEIAHTLERFEIGNVISPHPFSYLGFLVAWRLLQGESEVISFIPADQQDNVFWRNLSTCSSFLSGKIAVVVPCIKAEEAGLILKAVSDCPIHIRAICNCITDKRFLSEMGDRLIALWQQTSGSP